MTVANYNDPFDPRNPRSFLEAAMRSLGRDGIRLEQMRFDPGGPELRPQDMEMRRYAICACGDPMCGGSDAEAQEAARRGLFSSRDREEMMRMAAEARSRGTDRFNYAGRPETPSSPFVMYGSTASAPEDDEEAKLDELRDAIEEYIVEAPSVGFDDIKGNEEALEQLKDAIRAPVEHKELYELYDMDMPKGALLSGPPGCGKTMFAKAAASEMEKLYDSEVEMISISGGSLQQPFVGVTEKLITAIFAFARQYRKVRGHPLLVFIDEAEVLFPDRTGRVRRVAPWEESQVATFLAEMDGMEECGAFVLLASNRPEVIDSALLRDGRCDFKITIKRPNAEALEAILRDRFRGIFSEVKEDELVFAALESFLDPHKVLLDFHDMVRSMEDFFAARGYKVEDPKSLERLRRLKRQRFTFEMIVNGAMAASVPMRAKRLAFSRDKANGTMLGVIADDVVKAVSAIFEENKGLEHAYALREFMAEVDAELKEIG
jgi:SpoVK/Ycf46/Vps4 family AAA+-type ATPase